MKLHEHLDKQTLYALRFVDDVHKARKRNDEHLTDADIKELMGTNRQTYRRKNGKLR